MNLKKLSIYGLFGEYNIDVDMTQKCVILVGANGTGKSTTLHIIDHLCQNDFISLGWYNFDKLEICTDNASDKSITIKRSDLFPSVDDFLSGVEKCLLDEDEITFYSVDLFIPDEDIYSSKKREDESESNHTALIERINAAGLYEDMFLALANDRDLSGQILAIINGFMRSNSMYVIGVFRQVAESFLRYNFIGEYSSYKSSKVNQIVPFKFNNSPFCRYIDLVSSYNLMNTPINFSSNLLHWMADAKKLSYKTDFEELHNITPQETRQYVLRMFGIGDQLFGEPDDNQPLPIIEEWSYLLSHPFSDVDVEKQIKSKKDLCMKSLLTEHKVLVSELLTSSYYSAKAVSKINSLFGEKLANELVGLWNSIDSANNRIFSPVSDEQKNFFNNPQIKDFILDNMNHIISHDFPISYNMIYPETGGLLIDSANPDIGSNAFIADILIDFYNIYKNTMKRINPAVKKFNAILKNYFIDDEVKVCPGGIIIKRFGKRLSLEHQLSAGERKIVLLFILRVFYSDLTLMFDEPELSLSIVWLKTLLPDMLSIKGREDVNLIIATQSPYLLQDATIKEYIKYLP